MHTEVPSTSSCGRAYQTADAEDLAAADETDALYLVVARTMFFASKNDIADFGASRGMQSVISRGHHFDELGLVRSHGVLNRCTDRRDKR